MRLEYNDVYVTKLKEKQISPKLSVVISDTLVLDEIKISLPEPVNKEVFQKRGELEKEEKLPEVVPKEKVVVKGIKHETTRSNNIEENGFWKYLFFITLIVLLFFIRLRVLSKREIEILNTRELITQGKLSQTILEVKKKEKFLSYASHELRTPMTAIIGLTHLVLENDLSKSQYDYIQKIEVSAQHLLSIVNDLLDISKLEEAEIKIEKVEFNINDILEYAINIVSMQAKNNNVTISLNIEGDVPSMMIGDPLRLGQVLINLLSNSVKFTQDGDVNLSVKKLSDFAESITLDFAVSDTGIGMTPEQVKNIFESYSQADESTSRKFGGTGLGLAISKQLVELMNGKIKVHSKKEQGSTFSFYIDFHLKDSQNKRQYRLPSSKLLGKRILVVDSSSNNAFLLSRYLTYFNYKINSIPSFEEVVFEKEIKYDIIIINHMHLTKRALAIIKEMQKNHRLKIVVLKERYRSIPAGLQNSLKIDASLDTPFTQQSILNMIVELYVAKNLDLKLRKLNIKNKLKEVSGKKILVVEDNQLNYKVISGLLVNTEIDLTFVSNGQEAVDLILKDSHYDLVLMDINMPIMDGYEATRVIRKHKQYNSLPILALTADVMEESIEEALSSGMQGYITKPIIVDIFYKKILDMLNNNKIEINNIKSMQAEKSDGFEELSTSIGLERCNADVDFYKSILKDFKIMYTNSSITLEELCKEGRFKEARAKAMDIKDISLNIGAYNVCEHAATMEYEFEKGERSHWKTLLDLYTNSLEKLFKDIDKYIKNS